jgi:hypothetical protein
MINQMVELAQAAPWFEADAVLRDAAIEETVAYTARGEAVRSERAQEAWEALRGRQLNRLLSSFGRGVRDDIEARKGRGAALYHEARDRYLRDTDRSTGDRDQWLREWNQWVTEKRS